MEKYEESLEELKLYLHVVKIIPNEKEWNRYAEMQKLFTSKSIEYIYGTKFNKLCRKLIKGRKKYGRKANF